MSKLKPIPQEQWHNSQRGYFAGALYNRMLENDRVWLVTGDLGYGVFDRIKEDFPDRFLNTGAAEQSMMGIAVGLAMEGKVPFVYSITPFLLWRAAETIRLYVNHEKIPVKLVGSGRDQDYAHDGFSHDALDAQGLLTLWPNIQSRWPEKKEEVPDIVEEMLNRKEPYFVSLTR